MSHLGPLWGGIGAHPLLNPSVGRPAAHLQPARASLIRRQTPVATPMVCCNLTVYRSLRNYQYSTEGQTFFTKFSTSTGHDCWEFSVKFKEFLSSVGSYRCCAPARQHQQWQGITSQLSLETMQISDRPGVISERYHGGQNDYLPNFDFSRIILGKFVFLCLRKRNSKGTNMELPSKNTLPKSVAN